MKGLLLVFGFVVFAGCTKNKEDNPALYAGTYTGDIEVYRNGVFSHTLSDHSIIIHPATWGDYAISNNVINRSTAPIANNILRFDRAMVGTGAVNIYEYGQAVFGNNTLTIEFYQEEENASTQTITRTDKFTGILSRQ